MAKDFLGIDIRLGNTVVFITTSYRDFSKGVVTKIGNSKVTIEYADKKSTTRYFYDVLVFIGREK